MNILSLNRKMAILFSSADAQINTSFVVSIAAGIKEQHKTCEY